jgi:hypothetical protein
MNAEVVPFGKYKGQPVAAMAADEGYCEWLTAQPWFRQRYANVYNILIQGGVEQQESPEHNQMQALFLDDAHCFALADLLHPRLKGTYTLAGIRKAIENDPIYKAVSACCELELHADARITRRKFEDRGWDITFGIGSGAVSITRVSVSPPLPACICECQHTDCPPDSGCKTGPKRWLCRHIAHKNRSFADCDHCTPACYWSSEGPLTREQRMWLNETQHWVEPEYRGTIRAELKPDLGDDYPAVLRQVTSYPNEKGDKRCVIARRYEFEHVTWEQVKQIFAASNIVLLAEGEIAGSQLTEGK